ncbi:MAG: hypothetical protein JST16_10930 [Bdellovibrionales bacterium]|nr:hypothetical protein [Bdellovibrionales bacterium]
MKFIWLVIFFLSTPLSQAENLMVGSFGLRRVNLTNDLMTSTNTEVTQVMGGNVELIHELGRGPLSVGLRAQYYSTSVEAGSVTLSYRELPLLVNGGFTLGSRGLRLRVSAGAGYVLSSKMTFDGSGSTDGDYSGKGAVGSANFQLLYFLGKKARLGFMAEAGYLYSFNKVFLNVPVTSPDLDGDPSGISLGAGVVYSF